MKRRTFLRGGATLAAGALVPAASAQDAAPEAEALSIPASGPVVPDLPSRRRPIRYTLKLGMVGLEGSLTERFGALREMGYDGVEPDSPGAHSAEELLEAASASGLAIPGLIDSAHWRDTFGDPDPAVRARGREALETALRDAAQVGASTVLVVPAVVSGGITYEQAWDRSREEIGKLVPLAEELGVTIAFENVWNRFLLSPREAREYVDSFESAAVGWYLDTGNLIVNAWPEHWIETLGKRVVKLDVKDFSRSFANDRGLWSGFEAKIGDGDCDWPAIGRALDGIGYDGWASAEVGGGGAERLREILFRMDRALQS